LIVLLGAFWSLWGAFWLRRVELVRENQVVVSALGLHWGREGFGPSVRAAGHLGGAGLEIVFRRGIWREAVFLRHGGETGGRELLDRLLAQVSAEREG
jgi:hypothetical protein